MQRLEVSGAVRLIFKSLGVKGLKNGKFKWLRIGSYSGQKKRNYFLCVTRGPKLLLAQFLIQKLPKDKVAKSVKVAYPHSTALSHISKVRHYVVKLTDNFRDKVFSLK